MSSTAFLQNYLAHLHDLAFKDDPNVYELLTIVFAFSIFWAIFFYAGGCILRRMTYNRPWLRLAAERDYERSVKEDFEKLDINMTKEEVIHWMMSDWPNVQVMTIQHLFGCILCIPSLLGIGDVSWASSLAVLAVLSEMGWEIEDLLRIVYIRFLTKEGSKKIADVVLIVSAFHHSLTTILGLPMALHYRELKAFHFLCFDLQLGATAFALIEYSKLLDLSKPNELRQFKILNFILLILMTWTRFLHWIYLCAQIMMTWHQDGAWTFLKVGSLPIILFSIFNAHFCVIRMYKRFRKFIDVSVELESLPSDVTENQRRLSTVNLEKAAEELLESSFEDDEVIESVSLLLQSFERPQKKVDRRQSVPLRRRASVRSLGMIRRVSGPALIPGHLWKEE